MQNNFEYNPHKNPDVITIIKMPDGNWKAEGQRFGKLIGVRGGMPHAVLEGLLTHDGKATQDKIV